MFCWTLHLRGGRERDDDAAVAVENKVYRFGGSYHGDKGQIEVNVFNTATLRWKKLPRVTDGGGERHLEVPSWRLGHTAVLVEDTVYIWGGYNNVSREDVSVLYAFDVDDHSWFKPQVAGTVPEAWGRNHSACVLGKVMFIYGRYTKWNGWTNDMYKLDTSTMVWSSINTRGTPPPATGCHSVTIIGTKMFVCAFYDNSIRVFDTENDLWLSTPSAQLLPGRWYHSAFTYNGELYISGGCNRGQALNDVWKFSPETFTWKKVEPKGKPGLMHGNAGCCIVGDRIILFGGHDLHILDLSPSLKTLCELAVIQHGLEQSGLPHNVRWEVAAMTSTNN